MNFSDSLKYLYSLGHETLAMKFGLDNTEKLLAVLNNPQKSYFKIQIAGTNGKGSVAAFLDSICRAASIKTGLFTSPHLVSITERIKIQGVEISEENFAALTDEVKTTAENLVKGKTLAALPTFFEHLTAIGLIAFESEKIDVAILETGLGGKLDSVTAAGSEIVAITPIAFDHQEYLGNALTEIAAEKAAIIYSNTQAAIIAKQEPEAMRVILERCRETEIEPIKSAKITKAQRVEQTEKLEVDFETENDNYPRVLLGLPGRHQAENAATAIAIAESLRNAGFKISRENIIAGLEKAKHAGRLEFWSNQPQILFDGAHNAAGSQALREFLQEFTKKPMTLVFSAMRDKDLAEIAEKLFPLAEKLILTRADNSRSAAPEKLREVVPADFVGDNIYLASTLNEALRLAFKLTPTNGLICVTGSLYLVGEAQSALIKLKN